MPVAAPIVAYFALTGVAAFVVTTAIYLIETMALNAVLRALAPRGPKPVDQPRTQSINDSLAHGKIIYGSVCVGGAHIIPPVCTAGTDPTDGKVYAGHWTHRGLVLAQHEIDSFGPVRFEQNYIDQSKIRAIDNTLDSGLVLASGNPWDNTLGGSRWCMVRCRRGTTTETADYILTQGDPAAFTANFRSRGVATAFLTFGYGDIFQSGVPPLSFCVNGKRVYDPRLDSTNGGSGTHRYSTPSTWEYSNNPILCAADLIIFDRELGGGGYDPATDIDWSLAAAAANICDASVDSTPTITGLVSQGTTPIVISGNTCTKVGGASAWDSSVRGSAIKAGRISWRASPGLNVMAGLNADPTLDATYTSIDYAWYATAATGWLIYESGANVLGTPVQAPVQATDIAEILYDGTNILYVLNGKLYRQVKVPTPGMNLSFDSSFFSAGASIVVNQQKRYTCNLELDGAALFEDNLGYLIDASFGRAIDRDGMWRLYAGAWDSPTSVINQSDWIGAMQVQAVAPRREGRWNGVRCFYYDPLRNWQRVECNPRTNAAYKSADGGERIWQELDRPAVSDESTAQRVAEFTLRQSRNGIKITGTLPPRFQYLAIWETVTINFADMGWTGKGFRLMNYALNPDGSVGVSFTEEQASDWTDMASAEFNQPDQHLIPLTNEQTPRAPTFLTITRYSESIMFQVGIPIGGLDPGSKVQIWRGTNQTVFTGYTLAAQAASDTIVLKTSDQTPWYWRATIVNRAGIVSAPFPPNAANAQLIEGGTAGYTCHGVRANNNVVYKYDSGYNADNTWDSGLTSVMGYLKCFLKFKSGTTTGGNVMVGMSEDPLASAGYTTIDYAWYSTITDWRIYESGTLMLTITGAVLSSDVASMTYDGANVRYYLNGILKRTVALAGKTLFLDSSFYGFEDSQISMLEFGPQITPPLIETPHIGDGAATDLYVLYDASQSVAGSASNVVCEAITVPAHDVAHTAIVTATFQAGRTVGSGTALFWVDNALGSFSNSNQMDFGAVIDHLTVQFQVAVAAGQAAQTYRIIGSINVGTTVQLSAVALQVEIIKK